MLRIVLQSSRHLVSSISSQFVCPLSLSTGGSCIYSTDSTDLTCTTSKQIKVLILVLELMIVIVLILILVLVIVLVLVLVLLLVLVLVLVYHSDKALSDMRHRHHQLLVLSPTLTLNDGPSSQMLLLYYIAC